MDKTNNKPDILQANLVKYTQKIIGFPLRHFYQCYNKIGKNVLI